MAVLPILKMGDPRLLRVAQRVRDFDTPGLHQLVQDLRDTMTAANGAGLAAPQIGVDQRVVLFGFRHNARYTEAHVDRAGGAWRGGRAADSRLVEMCFCQSMIATKHCVKYKLVTRVKLFVRCVKNTEFLCRHLNLKVQFMWLWSSTICQTTKICPKNHVFTIVDVHWIGFVVPSICTIFFGVNNWEIVNCMVSHNC